MKTYLIPLDGSELSRTALPWAKLLADKDHRLRLLHCIDPVPASYRFPSRDAQPSPDSPLEVQFRQAREELERVATELQVSGVETSVGEGKAAEVILGEAEGDDIESIILASHGAGGLGKWLVGSVASKVLRGSSKPVLVVRADRPDAPARLTKIVLCLDGSELAERGWEPTARLARRFQAEVKLIQVVPHQGQSQAELQRKLDESAAYLKQQAQRFPDLKIRTAVRSAGILEGIAKETSGFDLTVVTSHGHGGFQRWLLGSLTEKLLHKGQTPLLVVPAV